MFGLGLIYRIQLDRAKRRATLVTALVVLSLIAGFKLAKHDWE